MPTSIVRVSDVNDSELQPLNRFLKDKCCIVDGGQRLVVA